jgi:hypothetical protein
LQFRERASLSKNKRFVNFGKSKEKDLAAALKATY